MTEPDFIAPLHWAANASFILLIMAIAIALYRLFTGPSIADRIVAVDLIGVLAVATIATLAVREHSSILLDGAIALALIAFLGTVAYARFLEIQSRKAQDAARAHEDREQSR